MKLTTKRYTEQPQAVLELVVMLCDAQLVHENLICVFGDFSRSIIYAGWAITVKRV